jgi:hypothetical protein
LEREIVQSNGVKERECDSDNQSDFPAQTHSDCNSSPFCLQQTSFFSQNTNPIFNKSAACFGYLLWPSSARPQEYKKKEVIQLSFRTIQCVIACLGGEEGGEEELHNLVQNVSF